MPLELYTLPLQVQSKDKDSYLGIALPSVDQSQSYLVTATKGRTRI